MGNETKQAYHYGQQQRSRAGRDLAPRERVAHWMWERPLVVHPNPCRAGTQTGLVGVKVQLVGRAWFSAVAPKLYRRDFGCQAWVQKLQPFCDQESGLLQQAGWCVSLSVNQ